MNLPTLLEMSVAAMGDRVFVGERDGGLTGWELSRFTHGVASLVRASGAEHLVMLDTNSAAVPLALFGAALAGVPFVPINYRLDDDRLRAVLGAVPSSLVIAGHQVVARVPAADGRTVLVRDEFIQRAAGSDETAHDEVSPDAVAVMLFTSGTSGDPKAALLRHRHLFSYLVESVDFASADVDDAQLVGVPDYHIAGVAAVLSCAYAGRRLVYLEEFDAQAWTDLVERERVTHAMVVPTMLSRIVQVPCVAQKLRSLRHLAYGGGRMPIDLLETFMDLVPDVDLVNAYGLTETSSTISVLTPADHREAKAAMVPDVRRRLGSVGRPLPSIELEIRDPASDVVVGAGVLGEVCVRGSQVAGEYRGRNMLDANGWFHTNDAGRLDGDGYLFLEGRLDDVIVRGGENLSPGEIEDVLRAHPDVVDAAVVGVADPEWGEAVAAAVVTGSQNPKAEDLREWVRARLRSVKTPAHIEFVDSLPYNDTGKLMRRTVRSMLADRV